MERVNFELGKTIVLPPLKQQLFESHNWQAGLHEAAVVSGPKYSLTGQSACPAGGWWVGKCACKGIRNSKIMHTYDPPQGSL